MGPSSLFRLMFRRAAAAGISFSGGAPRMMSTAAAVDPSRISPWLMLPPSSDSYKLYSLASKQVLTFSIQPPPPPLPTVDGRVTFVGSSHGWVATFNRENKHMFLSDPISGRHMKLPDMPESPFPFSTSVDKIILTSPPSAATDSLAVLTFGRGMAVCRPSAAKWTCFGDLNYDDMVYSHRHRRLFSINHMGVEAECWDLTDPESPTRDWSLELNLDLEEGLTKSNEEADVGHRHMRLRYLVYAEEQDRLLLVTRFVYYQAGPDGSSAGDIFLGNHRDYADCYPHKTFAFDVHEIGWEVRRRDRYLEDGCLNGLAMFVGINHSFAVPAAEFPELEADSIYFTDSIQDFATYFDGDRNYGGHDIGVYNYRKRSLSSAYYSCHASDFRTILPPPIWFTPTPSILGSDRLLHNIGSI